MEEKEARVGDIRPIFQQIGFEVCKNLEGKGNWVPVEKVSEAEILSYIYSRGKNMKPAEEVQPEEVEMSKEEVMEKLEEIAELKREKAKLEKELKIKKPKLEEEEDPLL